jgi:oligoribonuclease (3'-5' exoribonuclease)
VPNLLIFADTETTGLIPKGGHILELALVAVELPTFREVAHMTRVIRPPQWPTVRRNLHERVERMHAASGLLFELDNADPLPLSEHEQYACNFVQHHAPKTRSWHTPLAGGNQSFERKWFEEHMPKLLDKFHYRPFEVRTITLLQEWVFGEVFVESPHRALADCRKAILDVRTFLGLEGVPRSAP